MIHKHSDDTDILTCAQFWGGGGCWHFEAIYDNDVSEARERVADHLHGLHGGERIDLPGATNMAQSSGIMKYGKRRKMLEETAEDILKEYKNFWSD